VPTIEILPLGDTIVADEGTIMAAAQAEGYYWPTTCGGEGRCTTCACEVEQGAGLLDGMGRSEAKSLVYERGERILSTNWRLACQARLRKGDGVIVVRKPGVRRPGE
jgi:2Fe-2S ferredoxin